MELIGSAAVVRSLISESLGGEVMAAESSGEGLSVPDVNAMLASLDQANLPPEQLQLLRERLEGKKAEKEGNNRKSMQDYSMFALYLPGGLWQRLQSTEDNLSVLDAITQYLGTSLGMRCPSEVTQATLASLLVARQSPEHQPQLMTSSNLRALYLTVKSRVSSTMTKMKKDPMPKDCPYLQMLPSTPADLPEAYKALGLEFLVPAIPMQDILKIARHIPMRSTNNAAKTPAFSPTDPLQYHFIVPNFSRKVLSNAHIAKDSVKLASHLLRHTLPGL